MNIVKFSVTHPVTIFMCAFAAILFGMVSVGRLPVSLLPDISYPTLTIQTEYPDAAPEEVESLISEPLEQSVSVIRGLRRMRSSSRTGWSEITLEFAWDTDMDYAALDVREKIDVVGLPDDAETPLLLRYDPNLDPILRVGLHGDLDLARLRYLAEEVVKKDLESLDGVASVRVSGGLEEEVQVNVDSGRLASLGVPLTQVTQFLDQQNVNASGGRLRDRESEFLVRAVNEFESLEDIEETVLYDEGGQVVRLGDVATIDRAYKDRDVINRVRGDEAVELSIFREGDANTVKVADVVKTRMMTLGERLPEEVRLTTLFDQSVFIQQAISEVRSNAIIGGILAVIVLLAFLRNLRSTLIIGVSIPLSILVTFVAMGQMGISLNIMSLGGMALAVGMLVDNSVVVLEAIARKREEGLGLFQSAYQGASQVGRAVTASTLTTIAVFLPIIFVEGVAGQIFNDQAKTVTSALVVSLAVALTVIPMLAALGSPERQRDLAVSEATRPLSRIERPRRWFGYPWWAIRHALRAVFFVAPAAVTAGISRAVRSIRRGFNRVPSAGGVVTDRFGRVESAYERALGSALDRRGLVVMVALVLFGASVLVLPRLGQELIPSFTQGEFTLEVEMPPGTPQTATDAVVAELEHTLVGDTDVDVFYTKVGAAADFGGDVSDRKENLAQIGVKLASATDPAAEARVMERLRAHLHDVEGATYRFSTPSYFSFKTPVELELVGYNLDQLTSISKDIETRLADLDGLRDVRTSMEIGSPEVQVRFDRERMAVLGVEVTEASRLMRNMIRGQVATTFRDREQQLDVRVRATGADRVRVDDVRNLVVHEVEGVPIMLSTIAEVTIGRGPSEVTHVDQQRSAIISADLAGTDLGSAMKAIARELQDLRLPAEMRLQTGGQNEELQTSFRSLVMAILLAVFLVYMVMAAQFESFLHPFVIMFTVPLGLIGVVAALLVTNTAVSVVVFIGAILLCGIVVNNAIVLVDYVNQLRSEGKDRREALQVAARTRLRPIVITSLTTILGLLPMALGFGEGAEIRAPMAVTVIGGLAVGAFLTLFLIPVLYDLTDRGPGLARVASPGEPSSGGPRLTPSPDPGT